MSTLRRRRSDYGSLCEICGISFVSKFNKNRHLSRVHGIKIEVRQGPKLVIDCDLCGLKFAKKKYLLQHKRNYHTQRGVVNQLTLFGLAEYKALKNSLPPRNDYELIEFQPDFNGIGIWYYAKLKFSCADEANLIMWKEEYEALNQFNFHLENKNENLVSRALFQVNFKCHYSLCKTRFSVPRIKEPCRASLSLILLEDDENTNKGVIIIRSTHNHLSNYLSASSDLKEKFVLMYRSRRNVIQSLSIHREDMEYEYGDDFYLIQENTSLYPKQRWASLFYHYVMRMNKKHKYEVFDDIYKSVTNYNKSHEKIVAHFQMISENYIIIILNPFMQRVLTIKEAGEIMFINSSSNVDRYNCKAFLFMVHTSAGSLPVGCLITTSDNEDVMTAALDIYKNLLTEESFGGRGKKGPKLIITNDSAAERDSLSIVFNEADFLVSSFHVLQTLWQYIWDPSTGIHETHRSDLFEWVKRLVYAESESELEEIFKAFYGDSLVQTYQDFVNYVFYLYNERHNWALCMKKHLISGNRSTSTLCDIMILMAHDKNLERTKAFSPFQLFEYIAHDLTAFYEMKLLEVAAGYPNAYLERKFEYILKYSTNMTWEKIEGFENTYEIQNENGYNYYVDAHVGLCSCPMGTTGEICKHQYYLSQNINLHLMNKLSPSLEDELTLHYIITGKTEPDLGNCITFWFITKNVDSFDDDIEQIQEDFSNENELLQNEDSIPVNKDQNIYNKENSNVSVVNEENPVQSTYENFKNIFGEIIAKCTNNAYFLPGIQSFIDCYESSLNTDKALISSLSAFGKDVI